MIYPFVQNPRTISENSWTHKVYQKVKKGEKLTGKEQHYLASHLRNGVMKEGGWCFNLTQYLNLYWVGELYGNIYQVYAPTKKFLREFGEVSSKARIVLIKKKGKTAHK